MVDIAENSCYNIQLLRIFEEKRREMQQVNASAAPAENKMGIVPVGRLLASMAIPMMISH